MGKTRKPPEETTAPIGRRVLASLIDFGVIVAWLLVLTGVGFLIRPLLPPAGEANLPLTDVLAFVMTVLPVWCYLTFTEASARAGTLGKQRIGLRVRSVQQPLPFRAAAIRNAIKLLPWQLAHMAVSRFILEQEFTIAVTANVASLALAVMLVMTAFGDPQRRGLHDLLAGTRVVAAA